jgi:hypothetical protein
MFGDALPKAVSDRMSRPGEGAWVPPLTFLPRPTELPESGFTLSTYRRSFPTNQLPRWRIVIAGIRLDSDR